MARASLFNASLKALMVAIPTRIPVKEPGPTKTPNSLISLKLRLFSSKMFVIKSKIISIESSY